MDRILLVVIDADAVRDARAPELDGGHDAELAVCLVHDGGDGGLGDLRLQQRMTAALRERLGADAESIATFVVTGRNGDDADACAATWGATRVVRLDRDR